MLFLFQFYFCSANSFYEFWWAFSPKGGGQVIPSFVQLYYKFLTGVFTQGWRPSYYFVHPSFLWVLMGVYTQGWHPGYRLVHPTFFIYYDRRFHPRVAPGLSFCSSNFLLCFDGRFHPRVAPGLSVSSSNFLMRFDGRFHPRVAPRLTFCSSNFFMCFDGRFHPRVAPHLSKCQMGHKWSTNKVTVISNGGPNWSLIRKFNLVSPAQHWNPVVHSLATCGLCYLWQGVL